MSKFWHWGLRRQYSLQFGGWIEESPKRISQPASKAQNSSRGSSRTSTVFTSRWSIACFRPTAGPWLCLRCIAFVASCSSSTGTSQDFRKFIVAGMVWVADWRIIELPCLYWAVMCCFPVRLVLSTLCFCAFAWLQFYFGVFGDGVHWCGIVIVLWQNHLAQIALSSFGTDLT